MHSSPDIEHIEKTLGFRLPERHKQAMLDPTDPIHEACDFLLPHRTDKMNGIIDENEMLHSEKGFPTQWPSHLVAFASNGCGDYFAYDLSAKTYSIIYIDPDSTVEEYLKLDDKLTYKSFEDWYSRTIYDHQIILANLGTNHRSHHMIEHTLDKEHSILYVRPQSKLEQGDFEQLAKTVDPHIEEKGELAGLIIETASFPGWESLGAMASHFRFVREHHKHIKKIAVVTDSAMGNVAERLASHFVAAEIKHFPAGQLDDAKQWIMTRR